ncbi:MAG: Ig-like domain-containing protein [Ruminococcus sp.]
MKKLLSITIVFIMLLGLIPTVVAEETKTYKVQYFKYDKDDSLHQLDYINISNTNTEINEGESYISTLSPKTDTIEIDSLVVIMGENTPVYPTKNDDGSYVINIPKVSGDICIAVSIRDIGLIMYGGHGYNYYITNLTHVSSQHCKELKERNSEIATTQIKNCGTFFEDVFTPDEGYEIVDFKVTKSDNFNEDQRDITDADGIIAEKVVTKNDNGSYTISAPGGASIYVTAVAEPIGNPSETYSVNILNKTDAVISNNAVKVKKGDSYSTTISIKNKDEMGEIKVGVIMDDGTIVAPTVVDDYTLSVDIPKVTGNLYISAYTASKTSEIQAGSSGYGEIVRVLENAKSDMPNVKYYDCEEIYLPNGSFYFEETFTPKEGYAITEISAVETCAYLYNIENYYGEIHKGYSYTERGLFDDDYAGNLTKNEDGTYTLKYMPSGSIFVKVVAEKKPTIPEFVTSNITLKAGESGVINVVNGTVKSWSTSNKNVATVKDGKVTAVSKGTATITATLTTGQKLTCKVTVTTSPSLTSTNTSLKSGTSKTLKAVGGTVKSWTTSNKKVATVNNGKVTALNKGSATITATLTTGKKITCKVTVTTAPKLSKATVKVKKGSTATVKLSGKVATINNKYTNTKGAKITSKANATTLKIKGLKKGTTTLKIKVNGVKTLSLKVNVK